MPDLIDTPEFRDQLWTALRDVIDPELNCNIVDLGLIYSMDILPQKIVVKMTLTSPSCPVQESLAMGVQNTLLAFDEVPEVEVELVWDPPWNPSMMSPAGKAFLGVSA